MSWFDGTALANLAKSALKEAQRTIDKALDIQDEPGEAELTENVEPDDETGNKFFNSWGLDENGKRISEDEKLTMKEQWGSFTGSFFNNPIIETPKSKNIDLLVTTQKNELVFEQTSAPLATPECGLTPCDEGDTIDKLTTGNEKENISLGEVETDLGSVQQNLSKIGEVEEKVIVRTSRNKRNNSSNRNSYTSNRLSVISTESQRSSESVEVLTSISCATSPDAEQPSISTSSSMGLPHSSSYTDSVEVIDSLASPSSIEVIWERSGCDSRTQSSSESDLPPCNTQISSTTMCVNQGTVIPDLSPDSVEVIAELNECDEELSICESYNSLSESTVATILEPPSSSSRVYESYTDLSQSSSKFLSGESTPDVSYKLSLTQQHSSNDLVTDTIINKFTLDPQHITDYALSTLTTLRTDSGKLKVNLSEDNNLLAEITNNESSCEGTIMESSSEESKRSQTSSTYVKHLLEDAICDVTVTRETSPTFSDKSKSDLVKVGSEQTSEHTSGDELETTTSSDIEIISRYSPNGDSSSTTSRHSPAKHKNKMSLVAVDILSKTINVVKQKGHQREPSETSSGGSDDISNTEVDKLSKKLSELTEVLEVRESKLVELSRSNLELQERNQELKKQLEQARMETALRLSMGSTEALFAEKDEIISQLREEGEKLSKIQLKQSNLIKNLRSQEIHLQTSVKNQKQQITDLTSELEKLKKVVVVREESEDNKNEVINKLTSKVTRQDECIARMLSQMEDAVGKAERLRSNLDNVERELEECKKKLSVKERELSNVKQDLECNTRKELMLRVEESELSSKQIQQDLQHQLSDTREQMKNLEEKYAKREAASRDEIKIWMRRLQEAETRNEELAQGVSTTTRPLLRQIESLQSTMSHQRDNWEKQETHLLNKLEETQTHLNSLVQHEKTFKEETLALRSRVQNLENQLSSALEQNKEYRRSIELLEVDKEECKRCHETEKLSWTEAHDAIKSQLTDVRRELTSVEHQLAVERAATEAEKRRVAALQEQQQQQLQQQQNQQQQQQVLNRDSSSPRSSPTLSFGRESVSSSIWPQFSEDVFETGSISSRVNVYDSLRSSSSLVEGLQAQLKLREGEVVQLQWELQKKDSDRFALSNELSAVSRKLEELQVRLADVDKLTILQSNYDALLQMYGEKVEQVDELKLDLQDVKDMYKTQIDQLLKKEKQEVDSS